MCPGSKVCSLSFDVTVTSDSILINDMWLISVSVDILDINDHQPTFRPDKFTVYVQEKNLIGMSKPLPTATDEDAGRNGVLRYQLHEPQGP